jgi:hypothetical protein
MPKLIAQGDQMLVGKSDSGCKEQKRYMLQPAFPLTYKATAPIVFSHKGGFLSLT